MKNLLFLITLLFTTALSFAQVSVSGYYRSNGRTYVQPHQRTAPNYTRNDNYSTIGNVNPYTGVAGTKTRDYDYSSTRSSAYSRPTYYSSSSYSEPTYSSSYITPSYSSTQTIYTGSRGGQYYINSNGNKTYVNY